MSGKIIVKGASEHNLKGIDVELPTRTARDSIRKPGARPPADPHQQEKLHVR